MVVWDTSPYHSLLCVYTPIMCTYGIGVLVQEKNRSAENEQAKMEKLINFVKEPLLEQEGHA